MFVLKYMFKGKGNFGNVIEKTRTKKNKWVSEIKFQKLNNN